jgi:hypothetical protein
VAIAVLVATLVTLAASATTADAEATLPFGFEEWAILGGSDQPTNVESAKDGRVFVAEKSALSKSMTTSRTSNRRSSPTCAPRCTTCWDRGLC